MKIISHVKIADHKIFIKESTPGICEQIIAPNPHVYRHMLDITNTSSVVSKALLIFSIWWHEQNFQILFLNFVSLVDSSINCHFLHGYLFKVELFASKLVLCEQKSRGFQITHNLCALIIMICSELSGKNKGALPWNFQGCLQETQDTFTSNLWKSPVHKKRESKCSLKAVARGSLEPLWKLTV